MFRQHVQGTAVHCMFWGESLAINSKAGLVIDDHGDFVGITIADEEGEPIGCISIMHDALWNALLDARLDAAPESILVRHDLSKQRP